MAREDATIALGDVNRPGVGVNRHRADRRKFLGEPSARPRRTSATRADFQSTERAGLITGLSVLAEPS
jgi:hypothetical protein